MTRLKDGILKRLNILLFSIALTLSQAVLADNSARREAEILLNMMGMDAAMENSVEQMLNVQLQQNPAMAPYKQVMMEFFSKYMNYESLKPQMVELYIETFSAKELQRINAFYQTPTGRKTIEVMPQLMGKGAQIGAQKVQANIAELQQMIQAESQRLQQLQN